MDGYYSETNKKPRDSAGYLKAETRGRPHNPIELSLNVKVDDLKAFVEDHTHPLRFDGKIGIRLPGGKRSTITTSRRTPAS